MYTCSYNMVFTNIYAFVPICIVMRSYVYSGSGGGGIMKNIAEHARDFVYTWRGFILCFCG